MLSRNVCSGTQKNLGGQFTPILGGQFKTARGDQFVSALGGQFDRYFHLYLTIVIKTRDQITRNSQLIQTKMHKKR
jgi:hypothetical protein